MKILAFGPFELDPQSGELRKHGLAIRLGEQPLQILLLLLDRPGEVVTRDEVRQRLWHADTFVDFDAGLSSAVRKLRDALGDSAENPRYVQTLPRRGYRFVAPVAVTEALTKSKPIAVSREAKDSAPPRANRRSLMLTVLAVVVVASASYELLSARRNIRPIDREAYDLYLKGVATAGRGSLGAFRDATVYFEKAIAKQPDFAMAYAEMAQAQLQLVYAGQFAPRDVVPKAEASARRALELDASLPLAHRVLATILQNYYYNWEEADRERQRARATRTRGFEDHMTAANALVREGRFDEAAAEAERARHGDPLSIAGALAVGTVLRDAQQYERALAEFRRALTLNPSVARAYFQIAVTELCMSRLEDATRSLEQAVRMTPDNTRFRAYLAALYAKGGRTTDARTILNDLDALSRKQYVSAFGFALIYDALNEPGPAMAALEAAYDEHALEFAQLRQYPPFESLRSNPRYDALMHRLGRLSAVQMTPWRSSTTAVAVDEPALTR